MTAGSAAIATAASSIAAAPVPPAAPSLAEKVRFLMRPDAYPERPASGRVEAIETHMSWVFLAGRHAYKLKKPVRLDHLDVRTLEQRRRNGEQELRLNRRLAPDAYLDLVPLRQAPDGRLSLDGGEGAIVDWLVRMRRLPAGRTLDDALRRSSGDGGDRRRPVRRQEIERIGRRLVAFFRACPPVPLSLVAYAGRFRHEIDLCVQELTALGDRPLADAAQRIARVLRRYPARHGSRLAARLRDRRIVEGHGDLRPEHVFLSDPPLVIDCLEFSRELRLLDPLDEVAYLGMECERLGAAWIGEELLAVYRRATGDDPPDDLVAFYRAMRALIRARIAICHLREPHVRNPAEWPRRAAAYLRIAERDLRRLRAGPLR